MPSMRAVGRLDDGTMYFAPLRELPRDPDEDLVQCHLCGEWFRFLGSTHLRRTHGWTLAQYREAFQLRESISTCSRAISEKHRQHAKRRVKAGEFGTVHLVAAAAARSSSGDRRLPRWRSLAVNHPELLAELDPSRNRDLDPYAVAAGSQRTLWWRCERGHQWRASVNNRANGSGCPTCAADAGALHLRALARAQTQVSAERSLAVKHPELLTQLHATRNGDLHPAAIGAASKRKLWWRCAACGHEWQATVSNRAIRGTGCPACFRERHSRRLVERYRRTLAERNQRVSAERSLAVKHPELLAELHPTRNGDLDPYTLGAGSHCRLWWRCAHGHEWQTTVNTRSRGCGAPRAPKLASSQASEPRALESDGLPWPRRDGGNSSERRNSWTLGSYP